MAPTQLSSHFPAKRKERADSPLNPNNKKVQKAHTSDESDESVQRPASLTVDAWLEAKDEEELWYPAHVKQAAGRDVLIGFDGWDERWDEWIPKASPRLREHRNAARRCLPVTAGLVREPVHGVVLRDLGLVHAAKRQAARVVGVVREVEAHDLRRARGCKEAPGRARGARSGSCASNR